MLAKSSAQTDHTDLLKSITGLIPAPLSILAGTSAANSESKVEPVHPRLYRLDFEKGMVVRLTEVELPQT